MYEARKICNLLLAQEDPPKFELTNLRLNKLLFFIHGGSFAQRAHGLVRNHFEAWKLGPVIRSVYDTFKVYGESQILRPAEYLDYSSGEQKAISYEDISASDAELIVRIFNEYDQHSTNELVAMSHESGGPWDIAFKAWLADQRLSPRIPDELIRSHFLGESRPTAYH